MTSTYSQDNTLFFLLLCNYRNFSYLCTKPHQFSITFVYGFGHLSALCSLRPQCQDLTLTGTRVCFGHFHMLGPSKSFANVHGTTFHMICNVTMAAVLYLKSPCINAGTVLLAVSHFCFWKKNENANQNQIFPLLSVPFWTPPPLFHNRTHMLVHTHHTHKSGMLF